MNDFQVEEHVGIDEEVNFESSYLQDIRIINNQGELYFPLAEVADLIGLDYPTLRSKAKKIKKIGVGNKIHISSSELTEVLEAYNHRSDRTKKIAGEWIEYCRSLASQPDQAPEKKTAKVQKMKSGTPPLKIKGGVQPPTDKFEEWYNSLSWGDKKGLKIHNFIKSLLWDYFGLFCLILFAANLHAQALNLAQEDIGTIMVYFGVGVFSLSIFTITDNVDMLENEDRQNKRQISKTTLIFFGAAFFSIMIETSRFAMGGGFETWPKTIVSIAFTCGINSAIVWYAYLLKQKRISILKSRPKKRF